MSYDVCDEEVRLHQLRLKNAELRGELNRVKREHAELQAAFKQSSEQIQALERQRKKDCDYLLKQETELEKMREGRQQALNYARAHEEQANGLRQVINSTLAVKIKYENIIKLLVENESSRDFVLQAIELT